MSQARSVSFGWPGGELIDPPLDDVLRVMDAEYDGNWGPNQPVGEMEWYDPARPPAAGGRRSPAAQLILVRHPDRGWYFEYGDGGRRLAPLDPTGPPGHLRHWSWGEQEYFRVASFVPDATARQVVADFMASGRPSAAVAWAGAEEIGSRLMEDEYARRFGMG